MKDLEMVFDQEIKPRAELMLQGKRFPSRRNPEFKEATGIDFDFLDEPENLAAMLKIGQDDYFYGTPIEIIREAMKKEALFMSAMSLGYDIDDFNEYL